MSKPIVSVIMATYNRADTLPRAIDSVLNQDMQAWELIIVDDGSTDNSRVIIETYLAKESRIRAAFLESNMHVHTAKNTGFDLMIGEWFTTLDSDDEMVPTALSTMLRLLETVDPGITAITCNCLDTTTGTFSGNGLNHDQWLDFEKLVNMCSGEHWGLTKSSLLGSHRFNGKMRGGAESILWWKISQKAKRYYLHQALRIYHTEGADRISQKTTDNLDDRIGYYQQMAQETEYLAMLRQYRPVEETIVQRNIALSLATLGHNAQAWNAYAKAKSSLSLTQRFALLLTLYSAKIAGPRYARLLCNLMVRFR